MSQSEVAALNVVGLTAGYGAMAVVHGVSFSVQPGEILGILGRNGAGKTTTLMAIGGFLGSCQGAVTVSGEPLKGPAYRRTRGQLGIVLEGRSIIPSLTIRQGFKLANVNEDEALSLFPELAEKLDVPTGKLSGGQQQMMSVAVAIGRRPSVLLIDELSFGLAPALCDRMFEQLQAIVHDSSMGLVVVEQHIHYAAQIVHRALVMNEGVIVADIPGEDLTRRESEIEQVYLGGV
jgi:branched-chain amino acid transport system ATP-binding protein